MTPHEANEKIYKIHQEIDEFNRQKSQEIERIKRECSHDWKYSSDPSGGNDSGYICQSCNKEQKHI